MKAKFVYEDLTNVLKPKDLSPEMQQKWRKSRENLTLDDIWDDLSDEQRDYLTEIIDNKNTIRGMWDDKWYKNGGWNGMMDAIDEFGKLHKIKQPDFDDLPHDIDIWNLIMKEISYT